MSASLKVPVLSLSALKQPFRCLFRTLMFFQSKNAAVLVETEAQMPRTYPSDAEACLSLSGKTGKDFKFRSLVQKEGKLMTFQNIPIREKVARIRNKALRDARAVQHDTGVLKLLIWKLKSITNSSHMGNTIFFTIKREVCAVTLTKFEPDYLFRNKNVSQLWANVNALLLLEYMISVFWLWLICICIIRVVISFRFWCQINLTAKISRISSTSPPPWTTKLIYEYFSWQFESDYD